MSDYDDAKSAALKQAAEHIADALRRKSPSERIAGAWKVLKRGEKYSLRNGHVSAVATNANWHHYSWGRGPTHATNEKRPDRSNWAVDAVEDAISDAQEQFRGEYLQHIAATSKFFSAR